jgi:hypothetical protein
VDNLKNELKSTLNSIIQSNVSQTFSRHSLKITKNLHILCCVMCDDDTNHLLDTAFNLILNKKLMVRRYYGNYSFAASFSGGTLDSRPKINSNSNSKRENNNSIIFELETTQNYDTTKTGNNCHRNVVFEFVSYHLAFQYLLTHQIYDFDGFVFNYSSKRYASFVNAEILAKKIVQSENEFKRMSLSNYNINETDTNNRNKQTTALSTNNLTSSISSNDGGAISDDNSLLKSKNNICLVCITDNKSVIINDEQLIHKGDQLSFKLNLKFLIVPTLAESGRSDETQLLSHIDQSEFNFIY